MEGKAKLHEKRLLWTAVFENMLIAAVAAFLLVKLADFRIGDVSDDYFIRCDNVMLQYISIAVIFTPIEAMLLKLRPKLAATGSVKTLKESILILAMENLYLIGVTAFYMLRYGSLAVYHNADGTPFTGKDNIFNMSLMPFAVMGAIGAVLCLIYLKKINRDAAA